MQRNTLFGGMALLLAGGVIGAGAMISSSAMADTPGSDPAKQLTMVNMTSDGEGVRCTFQGAELDGMLPDLAVSSVVGSATQIVGAAAADEQSGGQFTVSVIGGAPADGSVPVLDPKAGDGSVVISSGTIIGVSSASGVPAAELPVPVGDVKVLSAEDARDGTPEECAAMHDQAVEAASHGPGQVFASSGSVDATKP